MQPPAARPPECWTDHFGRVWKVPQIRGRLKFHVPCHRALRAYVLHRDGDACRICGATDRDKLVADHIRSRRNGGSHHPDNLQALCGSCNARKSGLVDAKARA